MADTTKTPSLTKNNNGSFRWNEVKDGHLLTEVRVTEPYLYRAGSKEAGQTWSEIADHLNCYDGFKENPRDQRSVRERLTKLLNDFKRKNSKELAATGISPDPPTENEMLLEEIAVIIQNVNLSEQGSTSKSSQNKDRGKAMKIRDEAMKTWSKGQKEDVNDIGDSEDSDAKSMTTPRRKRQRRSGSEALNYLQEKCSIEAELIKEELAFHKEQAEVEKQRIQLEQQRQEQALEQAKLHNQQMQQQATLQQQQYQMLQQQMQQQAQMQNTTQAAIVAILEKLAKT